MKKRLILTSLLTLALIVALVTTVAGCAGEPGLKGSQGEQGIQGEQGERGLAGPQGSTGAKGATGSTGATGTQGIQGEQGPAGPAGAGASGPRGATGPRGPAGSDAECTGLQAQIDALEKRISALEPRIPPTIDGVIEADEWGAPLCVKSEYGESVTVYAIATTKALFMAFDSTDNLDERAVVDTGTGSNDALDWNVGLVDSDMSLAPWCYTLHTKAQSDSSWGGQFSEIDNDGTGRVYRGTWGVLGRDPHYSSIPAGIEMVTSFDTGNRVTEVKVPMSLMFDGQHGWDGPNAGDVLLLGGMNQVEPDGWPGEWAWDHGLLFWPDGWDSGNADTYATSIVDGETYLE